MTSHLNIPRPNRRTVQHTLTGAVGINDQTPRKKDNQPETRPVGVDELRVYFQSVNGIKSGTNKWEEMVMAMAKNNVGIFGFAETNFNWNNTTTRMCVNRAKAAIR